MRSWIEISRSALYHNITTLEKLISPKELGCVVKNNAYGHGLEVVSDLILARNANYFLFTAGAEEAITLKERHPNARVCPMSFIDASYEACVAYGIRCIVYSQDEIDALNACAARYNTCVSVHLKVDTGMYRLGVPLSHADWFIAYIRTCRHLYLEGIVTHLSDLACSQQIVAKEQLRLFRHLYMKHRNAISYWHAGSTGSVLMSDISNLTRVGTGLYGLLKSRHQYDDVHAHNLALCYVMSWYTNVIATKWVPPHISIGYDRCYTTRRWTRTAYIPIGYGDGYPCALSNTSVALVRGAYAPLIGFTSMNVIMLDITDIPSVSVGDVVTLIGSAKQITSDYLARQAGHIRLELLSNINPGIPRMIGV